MSLRIIQRSMDFLHFPDSRKWVSKPIHLNQHFADFAEEVKRVQGKGRVAKMKVRMDIKNVHFFRL